MAELTWTFGLTNFEGKYLTAETFGFKLNTEGGSLKKKQIFTLEQPAGSDKIYLKSCLNRYVTANAAGVVSAESETRGADQALTIEAQKDGKWAFKTAHGYYLGGAGTAGEPGKGLSAYTKVIAPDRLWVVHLAMHPQIWLRNINRKAYVHLKKDQLTTDEIVPWGDDALITLHFFEEGKYAFQACNGKFLSADGQLKGDASPDCRFILEFQGGELALKSHQDQYLTALGGEGVLRATKKTISKDELFVFEDCQPQFKFTAFNGKKVSVRGGVEATANQDESTDAEFYQLDINRQTKQWSVRTHKNQFWSQADDGTILATATNRGEREWFNFTWLGPKCSIKAANGKFVSTKKNGGLIANSDSENDESTYVFEIINRPRLALRGEHGFVNTLPSGALECNKSTPEAYQLHVTKGVGNITGANGKYWKVGANGVVACNGDQPEPVFMEFVEHSKCLIKMGDKYLQGSQNGGFTATGTKADASTLWEY